MRKLFLILMILGGLVTFSSAKKIKNSFKVDKENRISKKDSSLIQGLEVNLGDSLTDTRPDRALVDSLITDEELKKLKETGFAGYDKEPNSNLESFLLVNPTALLITGYEVRIDYLDMQGRMLHSRVIKETCYVPPGETRRFDIKTWDRQHTYYYYLGNEPKKVATPFQVKFYPQKIWIQQEN